MTIVYPPSHPIDARVLLPGSKSFSNRWLILKHLLASGLIVNHLSDSDDTVVMADALKLVAKCQGGMIDVGHAGTDMRFLTALLSVTPGEWVLTGSARMQQRPIGGLVNALVELGANISYLGTPGFPPIKVRGTDLRGAAVRINGAVSSQFISALLLITPALKEGLTIDITGQVVSRPYINMTLETLKQVGMQVQDTGNRISVVNKALMVPKEITVESDWSAASYWYSVCALAPGATIELGAFEQRSRQADAVLPTLYAQLGVNTTITGDKLVLTKQAVTENNFRHDFTDCPDIAQTIAVTCLGLGVRAVLTGLKTLRIKETNRIEALATELRKCGGNVTISEDTLVLQPGRQKTDQPVIETYGDHRMAMSFAPLALLYPGLGITDAVVVNKSYGAFWDDLLSVGFNVNLRPL